MFLIQEPRAYSSGPASQTISKCWPLYKNLKTCLRLNIYFIEVHPQVVNMPHIPAACWSQFLSKQTSPQLPSQEAASPSVWLQRGGGSPDEVIVSSNLRLEVICLHFCYVLLATEPTMAAMWERLQKFVSTRRQDHWGPPWGMSTVLLKSWIIKFEKLLIKLTITITLRPASFSTQ